MTTTFKTPGVIIKEVPVAGPITGVGSSTAAFIGRASRGPVGVPEKITSWRQFGEKFGYYVESPRHYLAYAVEGFFRNGGAVAYIVRVGSAGRASGVLVNRLSTPEPALLVEALKEGTFGNPITVDVTDAQIVTAAEPAQAVREPAEIVRAANERVTVNDASRFRPGDVVLIRRNRYTIDRIRGNDIFLTTALSDTPTSGQVRIASLQDGQETFRVDDPEGLEAGSAIQISNGTESETAIVESISGDFITLSSGLTNDYSMTTDAEPVEIQSYEFTLTVNHTDPDIEEEPFPNLAMDSRHSRYFGRIIDSKLVSVRLPDAPATAVPPDNRPAVTSTSVNLEDVEDENLALDLAGYYTDGIDVLESVDDVNILCVPGRSDQTVQQAMITHCERMGDRFAILDPMRGADLFGAGGITDQRTYVESQGGFAALYFPWLQLADPGNGNGDNILVPPSGHVAGVYARSDAQRGVHKAPANEMIAGALGLERLLNPTELGELNLEGINVIRTFPNRARPTIWGARTTAPRAEAPWRYVNVRRLLLYIEESIEEGLRWAVFEPNNLALWQQIRRTISEFLTRVWQAGALFGETADQAFFVRCDEELNPDYVRALGQVIVEVGVAPVRPAEFIIIRINQWAGGSDISES